MYLMKISRSFHKIQEKSNIQKSFQLKIDMIYLLQAFFSTNTHQSILRKMSRDNPRRNPEIEYYISFLTKKYEKLNKRHLLSLDIIVGPEKGRKGSEENISVLLANILSTATPTSNLK